MIKTLDLGTSKAKSRVAHAQFESEMPLFLFIPRGGSVTPTQLFLSCKVVSPVDCSRPPQHNLRDPAGTLTVVSAANGFFFLSVKNEVNRNWACNAVFAAREGNIRHVEVPRAQAF